MDLTRLIRDEEGVSEVIGVILMVAITVILAAVLASMVLGIGGESQTTPTASFEFDYDQSSRTLTITHDSGENILGAELFLRGDCSGCSATWASIGGDMSATIGSRSAVASGDSVSLSPVSSDYDVRVVWQSEEGDTSATLGRDTGPDA